LLLHEKAARKDPAVHVSLSSDSLFKQPGDREDPQPPEARRVVEAHASEYNRMPFHCSSEELQRRVIAPTTSGWRADGRYIGFGPKPCQPKTSNFFRPGIIQIPRYHVGFHATGELSFNSCRAALRPYSWAVLAGLVRGMESQRGTQPPSLRPKRRSAALIDGPRAKRHRAGH
jgi:hypothetical protein